MLGILNLFFTFFKIGMFGFGGGYAMLPFIQNEVVNNNNWISHSEFLDIIGVSQMTPGPVAINTATFVGYKIEGIGGALFATLGVISFSFIAVILISKSVEKFKNNKYIEKAFIGLKPILIALIISAFISLAKESYIDFRSVVIGVIGFCLLKYKKVNPIGVIALSAIIGIVIY
ncbi:MAG: chromate transporter [Sarcina sp.]